MKKEILDATCTEATRGIKVLPLQTQDDGMSDATKGSWTIPTKYLAIFSLKYISEIWSWTPFYSNT